MSDPYYVYIMASQRNGTIYIGVTSDLAKRVFEHKHSGGEGTFTAKYCAHQLVYYETFEDSYNAICREKVIKRWRRVWKIALIEKDNKNWHDLYEKLFLPL